ncbi:MAG: Gfo/Idh/MocA family oxidoreductase [Cytophagales bacterium]|nr:Gfo/Idh/MocA family oxidoreductase [Armatimonadota bacterium]
MINFSSPREIGIALIGAGGMSASYRDNYAAIPGTKYRLVVDVNEDLARDVAERSRAERWSSNWRDALADDIQVVDISTPNHLHAEQATALLGGGKQVILQKPMAPSIAECQAILEASRASGAMAGVYMSDLEDPVAWDLRDLVQGGYLGQISSMRGRYAHRGGLRAAPSGTNWRASEEKTGGGSFMQLSIHHTNLLSWILDDTIDSVMAYAKNQMCPNIGGDDTTVSVAEFARSGVLATFDSAWNAEGTTIEIYGSEGHIRVLGGQGAAVEASLNRPFHGRVLRVVAANTRTLVPSESHMLSQCGADNPLNQHVAFVRAVQQGTAAPVPASVGLYDVAVVKAVYLSAQEGRRVSIKSLL